MFKAVTKIRSFHCYITENCRVLSIVFYTNTGLCVLTNTEAATLLKSCSKNFFKKSLSSFCRCLEYIFVWNNFALSTQIKVPDIFLCTLTRTHNFYIVTLQIGFRRSWKKTSHNTLTQIFGTVTFQPSFLEYASTHCI